MSPTGSKKPSRCRGQAMTEYVVVMVFVIIATAAAIPVFMAHVSEFYINVIKFVCLPFP